MRKIFLLVLFFLTSTIPSIAVGQEEMLADLYELEDVLGVEYLGVTYEDDDEKPEIVAPILFEEESETLLPKDIPQPEYMRGIILEIIDQGVREEFAGYREHYQTLQVAITSGPDEGKEVIIENSGIETIDTITSYDKGGRIVVVRMESLDDGYNYFLVGAYRLNALLIIFAIFVLLVLWLARFKGIGSLLGLGFSILILSVYIVPQISQGANPVMVTLLGSALIMLVSLYLAHGFNHRTTLSLVSTFITLTISLGMATLFVHMTSLLGLGSEEAFYLQSNQFGNLNLQGLLLAGILIGTLGVLDDITTAQTAVVGELRYANKDLSKKELYLRALVVGKEHISSLVNTLVLAYAGASLPLFLLFSQNINQVPLWYTLNSEFIAEEIVRTLVGSLSLILAVPIASYIAAHFISKKDVNEIHSMGHTHHH